VFQEKGVVRRAMRQNGRAENLDQPGRNRGTGRRYVWCRHYAICYATKTCVYNLIQNTAALSRCREDYQAVCVKHTTWQNIVTLATLFPLAGVWHVGLHRRCSHTVQPARVCSSNGSKRVPTQGREWAVYSSQHGMESADTADAGRCKDQLPSTSQAHLGGTGSVGQVGPSALLCHDLSLLAESCTAEFQICFRSVSTVCTMRSAGFTLLTDFILCS